MLCTTYKNLQYRQAMLAFAGLLMLALVFLLHGQAFCMGLSFGGTTATTTQTPQLDVTVDSSIPTGNGSPARIAIDGEGVLYVASPGSGRILKFSPEGALIGIINGFKKPLSVAVDASKKLFVGDYQDGSVSAFGPDGKYLFSLGAGKGEFSMPGDIAAAPNGNVYVTDSTNNVVKVYDAEQGTFKFSFGGYGTGNGQMNFPTGIAVYQYRASQRIEIYVVDNANGRVEVFNADGTFKKSFGGYGGNAGQLTRPQGIFVHRGKVYVSDAYQSSIQVFDTNGTFIQKIGEFGSDTGKLKVPTDVVMRGNKLFVSNSDNGRIEVFRVRDPKGLAIDPETLTVTAYVDTNPEGQAVQVNPEIEGSSVAWTSTIVSPFPVTINPATGTTPSSVSLTVNVAGLDAGEYTGEVIFLNSDSVEYPLTVELTVKNPQQLFISPPSVNFFYQKNGDLGTKTLSLTSGNGSLNWTAQIENGPWFGLSASEGATPSTLNVSLNQGANGLAEGTYNASITVNAGNAVGSPAQIPVTLRVVVAGTVQINSNLEEASYTITGPVTYSGSGTFWRTDEAKPGVYEITFGFVEGYRKPATKTFQVVTGKAVTIDGTYRPLRVANVIVAAKGPNSSNDAKVRVLGLDNKLISEFKTFTTSTGASYIYGAHVATADFDGDGTDEVIVAPGPNLSYPASVKIFKQDGAVLSSTVPITGTRYGANITAGDVLGDGTVEVMMSMVSYGVQSVVVYTSGNGYQLTEKRRFTIPYNYTPARLTLGDVDGDGKLELIVFNARTLKIYEFDENLSPTEVASGVASTTDSLLPIAAGDLDRDGTDEILLGYRVGLDSYVKALKGDLTPFGAPLKVFTGGNSAPNLSALDTNGDGIAEILVGKGNYSTNDASANIIDAAGKVLSTMKAFETSTYGVNAVFGVRK